MKATQVPIIRWVNKKERVHIYTMEYYMALKKNGILPFATTWKELEGIIISEISHSVLFNNKSQNMICSYLISFDGFQYP